MGDLRSIKTLVCIKDDQLKNRVIQYLPQGSYINKDIESLCYCHKFDLIICDFLPDDSKITNELVMVILDDEQILSVKENNGVSIINKSISDMELNARICLMLSSTKAIQKVRDQKEVLMEGLWQMFNISPFYFVVTNTDNNIIFANVAFARDIKGDINSIINTNIYDYITDHDRQIATFAFDSLKYGYIKHIEAMYDITTIFNKPKTTRWFMTFINSGMNLTLNIGIPTSSIETDNGIESIRTYYQDTILKDRQLINAIKTSILERDANG